MFERIFHRLEKKVWKFDAEDLVVSGLRTRDLVRGMGWVLMTL